MGIKKTQYVSQCDLWNNFKTRHEDPFFLLSLFCTVALQYVQHGHGHRWGRREKQRNDSCGDSETQWCTLRKRPAKSQKAGRHTLIGRARKGDRCTDIFMEWYPCNMTFMVSLLRTLETPDGLKALDCALETYVLTQPLMSSVTLDKSTDISLSGISHWLSYVRQPSPRRQTFLIARNSATVTSAWQRFKGRQGNLLCASDKSFWSSFIYRKVRKMAPSKARKLKSLSKLAKGDGDSCTIRVLVALRVRSHWVKMASLAPSHLPGPVKRNWYGVNGPKKMVKARRGSVSSMENRLGFALIEVRRSSMYVI